MNEKDVIFGVYEKFERCIEEAVKIFFEYSMIFVYLICMFL